MEDYQQFESDFVSSHDRFKLYWQKWIPKGDLKRVIVIQHGFGEHCGRYGNVLSTFSDTGTAFYALDSRGHGRSPGKRGHVDQFQQYVDDLADLIHMAREETKQNEVFLLGHSLGGVIALQYALQGTNQLNLRGLIVSSPALEIQMDLEKEVKKVLVTVFSSVLPSFTLDANLEIDYLSHDKKVVEDYKNDPLVHGQVSFQMAENLFLLGRAIYDKVKHLKVPIYIYQGTDDGIVSPKGSTRLHEMVASSDKTLKLYDGLYHETMNEISPEKEKVLEDLKNWVLAH